MFNYQVKIEYDGSSFVGWQYQNNGLSIQGKIEKVFSKVLMSKVRLIGAGRTDKGVHAEGQYANFKISKPIGDIKKFLGSVNFFLKNNLITIITISKKKIDFNSRYNAKERIYKYIIVNRESKLSLEKNRAWHIKKKLDLILLKKGAKMLEGKHDFSTFRAASCSSKSPIKKINFIKVKKTGTRISIIFSSKSFLQNQVRSMVGCLKYLATNKWSVKEFKRSFKSKRREQCAPPAPAYGLYLSKVKY